MKFVERAICFFCHDSWLVGILSLPEQTASRGVLIVVGGPQYRAGSHRQFTLIARDLAAQGVPVMRFDYRGMGDSEGDARPFDAVDDDIQAAVNYFCAAIPAMNELIIFGLCDAASAAIFYAHQDERIRGLILINPWVRTEQGIAKAYIKHYYLRRLFEVDLWRKIFRAQFRYTVTIRSFIQLLKTSFLSKRRVNISKMEEGEGMIALPDRMLDGFNRFKGQVLVILSGNDLTAREFSDLVARSPKWKAALKSSRVSRLELANADHTFSRRDWREQVSRWINKWIQSW